MTTAHRPTFDPARGKDNKAPTLSVSAQALPAHTKLKYRTLDTRANEKDLLREELLRAERKHYGKSLDDEDIDEEISNRYAQDARAITSSGIAALDDEQRRKLMEQARKLDADDDEDDDREELLRELEKIKRERAEEKARQEAEAAEEEERQRGEQVLGGNPLLNLGKHDFTVKRRWDDDVVFKNQAKGVDDKPKKRFINDLIRSDFHRKFMDKYVR
ncbi:Pre-mRNA-splicing factor Cwf15/Cwc15 [Syncephalis pseudoplumigaleata]|uniref:Pre-mRNA-splicing factor Cwf15/Cwc15 n=1 Tax=Syncephalis pseudoplumigaleata TaxID=1712513 RepID=A0A4P9YWU2_9FUNG|nr:Pre-mRNA-splicing factor Cwf15/Cwc15 [Syncephalis pseudoplumigaleata]|eukprot:RKP23791.1 Pre-mRNA-splicing factor Cwf15/Cwc15 [Syncephalis pseudoplumigaleata]